MCVIILTVLRNIGDINAIQVHIQDISAHVRILQHFKRRVINVRLCKCHWNQFMTVVQQLWDTYIDRLESWFKCQKLTLTRVTLATYSRQ